MSIAHVVALLTVLLQRVDARPRGRDEAEGVEAGAPDGVHAAPRSQPHQRPDHALPH